MESESRMPREEAARALRVATDVRARAAGAPRGHAVLQLLYAVMMSTYMALFVYTGSGAVDTEASGGLLMMLALPVMFITVGLVDGAGERYAGRLRATGRRWMTVGVFFAMLLALVLWSIAGGGYPLWVAPVSAAVTLIIFGIRPLGILWRSSTEPRRTVPPAALPMGTRITTLIIGVGLGAVCATVLVPPAGWLSTSALMLFTIAALAGAGTWGLRSTGWYWGLAQWIAFGVSSAVTLVLAGFLIATDLVALPLAITAGAVVAASLVVSAFLPGRGDEGEVDGAPEA